MAAAVGVEQLRKAYEFRRRRAEIAERYISAFSNQPALQVPHERVPTDVNAWHLFVLRLNLEALDIDRNMFIGEMAQQGVSCSVHFIPLHMHPYWRDTYDLTPAMFPVASREFSRVVSLPIYPSMTEESVTRVIEAVIDILARHRR
jgi:dTDP-4-amino-4,6-dideoxygalactose transaminase